MIKSILILVALGVGLLLPGLSEFSFTIRFFLMTLLFFSFLNVKVDRSIFAWQQGLVAVLLPFIGIAVYYLGLTYDSDLGLTLLLMGLAPTAVITPVLVEMMRRRTEYAIGAILVTHAAFALVVPVVLPALLGINLSLAALGQLVYTIGSTVAIPMLLAQALRRFLPRIVGPLQKIAPFAFMLFLSNVAVAAGSLSYYLRYESETPWLFVWLTAVCIVVLMLINFAIGSRLAPAGHSIEGSLALGRKNTMLSIWIALEYINPLVVLGPMLYILAQNVFVAGQIFYVDRMDKQTGEARGESQLAKGLRS